MPKIAARHPTLWLLGRLQDAAGVLFAGTGRNDERVNPFALGVLGLEEGKNGGVGNLTGAEAEPVLDTKSESFSTLNGPWYAAVSLVTGEMHMHIRHSDKQSLRRAKP